MENKNRKALSWSASFAIHATGAVLILVAGFHIATPEGTVTDKTEFEAVTAPEAPATQTDTSAVAPPVAPVAADQPDQPPPPAVDEAPPKPVEETQHDEEAPPVPTQEVAAPEAQADATQTVAQTDPAQDPSNTPSEAPTAAPPTDNQQVSPEATPGAEPVPVPAETPAAGAPSAANTNGDGVPEYGTPGSIIDESKLMEAFGNHKPDYPWMARLRRQQGTVILKAFINKEGHVEQAALEKSSGFPLIDDEAVRTYSRWKYQPGLTGWVLKPFKFSLK